MRMQMAFGSISFRTMQSILEDLQGWYSQLPQAMKIENLHCEISTEERRSIYHVHLLYLGSIILLYRRIACHVLQSYGLDEARNIHPTGIDQLAFEHAIQGFVAAKHSARILSLLLSEDGIFRKCWLVMQVPPWSLIRSARPFLTALPDFKPIPHAP